MEDTPNIDKRVRAFLTLVEVLQADAWIARREPVWLLPGDSSFKDPLPDDRYGLRLTPRTTSSTRRVVGAPGELYADSPLTVRVELRCPGLDWADWMNFWGDVEAALGAGLPGDERAALRRRMRAGGIGDWETTRPGGDVQGGVAAGEIVLQVTVPA